MSESELTQLRKGKIKKLLYLILVVTGLGAVITIIIIFYMNTGEPTGGWGCASINSLKTIITEKMLNIYYAELLKKIII